MANNHLRLDAAALLVARLYRSEDYARAGVPMLPVTHGRKYTQLQVLLYTLILFAASLLPYVIRMSGL